MVSMNVRELVELSPENHNEFNPLAISNCQKDNPGF